MVSVENELSVRPLFAAAAIMSIFVAGCLFTGAHLVNAQADEDTLVDYKLENIENLLTEIKKELDNMHKTYVTMDKLEDEMEIMRLEVEIIETKMITNFRYLQGIGAGILLTTIKIAWTQSNEGRRDKKIPPPE